MCHCGNTGVERIPKESAQKVESHRAFCCPSGRAVAMYWPWILLIIGLVCTAKSGHVEREGMSEKPFLEANPSHANSDGRRHKESLI